MINVDFKVAMDVSAEEEKMSILIYVIILKT